MQDEADLTPFKPPPGTMVVLPSHTVHPDERSWITGYARYEERLLFLLLTLRAPEVSIVFVSTAPVHPDVIDYYLGFLPDPAGARRRLRMVDLGLDPDADPSPLTERLLLDDAVRERIRGFAGENAWLLPFIVTPSEERLARLLGLPFYGPSSRLRSWGTKTGARRLAAAAGVATVPGFHGLRSVAEVEMAVRALCANGGRAVLKLDDGYGGLGNAVVEPPAPGVPLSERHMTFSSREESWPGFAAKIARRGAVAERLLAGSGLRSPSVLVLITPAKAVHVLATHEQLLDGAAFQGCSSPADAHHGLLGEAAGRFAHALAMLGATGILSLDFLIDDRSQGAPKAFLCDLNLRLGGTTHAFGTAFLATGAVVDEHGRLVAGGRQKTYRSTDNLHIPQVRGLEPAEILARLGARTFAARRGTGVILHMFGAAKAHGKIGLTAIGESAAEASQLCHDAAVALAAPSHRKPVA